MDPAHFLVAQDSSAICPSFTHFLLFTPVLILFHSFRPCKEEKTLSPFFQRAAQKAFTNFPDKKTRGDVFLSLSRISSPSGGSRKTPPNSTPWKPVFSHPFFTCNLSRRRQERSGAHAFQKTAGSPESIMFRKKLAQKSGVVGSGYPNRRRLWRSLP